MSLDRGDVVIALFPNADGSPPKARPVLVVQADVYNAKLENVIVAVTSNLSHAADPASLLIEVSTPDGRASGLRQDSVVSCILLATIADSLIARRIGRLTPTPVGKVNDCLKAALGLPRCRVRPGRLRASPPSCSRRPRCYSARRSAW